MRAAAAARELPGGDLEQLDAGLAQDVVGHRVALVDEDAARGDGEGLEQTVDGLLWLANGGWVTLRIILLDDGLTETGRCRALRLVERGPRIAYCPPEAIMEAVDALER